MTDPVTETAERFARAEGRRSTYHYVRGKLRHDPCTEAIRAIGNLGDVLDLGCGRGHLAIYLLASGVAATVRGFDWDAKKVAMAQRAGDGLAATFAAGDVRTTDEPAADTVLLVDVLHYITPKEQDTMLERALDLVRPGGRLVIRDASAGFGWRSVVTLVVEWISTFIKFNLGEGVSFRNWPRDVVPKLEAHGVTCTITPCWASTPFSNVLVVATKPR